MTLAVVFPGQGAASPGMGRPWADQPAWQIVTHAEEVIGRPLAPVLLDASAEDLAHTDVGQLSVLLMSLMAYRAIADALSTEAVTAMAGHSLGQITALFAAGIVDTESGLRLAAARADASEASAVRQPGHMAALIGATLDQAHTACRESGEVWLANDNAPGQVVIAGRPGALTVAMKRARDLGVRRATLLPVGHAFHTPLLTDAAAAWQPSLASTAFSSPIYPVITNTSAQVYPGSDGWPEELTRHLMSPVRWRESQLALVALGTTEIVEVGPGSVLTGLARRTVPELAMYHVGTPDDAAAFSEKLAARAAGRATACVAGR